MEKKITKKEMFGMVKEIVLASQDERVDEMVAFIDREVELLNKKSASHTPTKTQKENEVLLDKIVDVLTELGKPVTVSELQTGNEEMAGFSNQKLSALLKKLVDTNKVVKTVDKKKSYFSV